MTNEENQKFEDEVKGIKKVKKDSNPVLQFRCTQKIHDEFSELSAEFGQGNGAFMDHMINCVKLNENKSKNVDLVGDINSLESHVNSIQSIFLNVIDKIEGQKFGITQDNINSNKIYIEKITDLEDKLEKLKLSNIEKDKALNGEISVNASLSENYNKVLETANDKLEIINSLKEKNEALVADNKDFSKYQIELDDYKKDLKEAQKTMLNNTDIIKNLNTDITNLNESHTIEIKKLKEENLKEIDYIKKDLVFKCKDNLFEQKEEITNKLNKAFNEEKVELNKAFSKEKAELNKTITENGTEFLNRQESLLKSISISDSLYHKSVEENEILKDGNKIEVKDDKKVDVEKPKDLFDMLSEKKDETSK